MPGRVLLINPNSDEAVTSGMARAVAPLAVPGGVRIETVTLAEGPIGIETQRHVEAVTLPLADLVARRTDADAFVLGCFSDPGLAVCREATAAPVLGIGECAVFAALSLGDSFGVVALGPGSVRRQRRAYRAMGIAARWVGSEPLHLSVADAENSAAFSKVRACGERLVAAGADAVILGCAGMARHRAPLADALGVPVIDPVQAATIQAVGLATLAAAARASSQAA